MSTTETVETKQAHLGQGTFFRWVGIAAMAAGVLYLARQALHPADTLESVDTTQWLIVQLFSMVMGLLAVIALTGIYAKQAHKVGVLGFLGYLLFSVFFMISTALYFIEAFMFPALAEIAPQYVEGLQGLVTGNSTDVDLGAFPAAYGTAGVSYLLGGIVLGISIFRAGVLPKWAGALLTLGAIVTLLTDLIPHPADRALAIPVGVAIIWLGWAMWRSARRVTSQE